TALIIVKPAVDQLSEPAQHRGARADTCRWRCRRAILLTGVFGHRIATDAQPAGDLASGNALTIQVPDIFLNGHGYRQFPFLPCRHHRFGIMVWCRYGIYVLATVLACSRKTTRRTITVLGFNARHSWSHARAD